MSKKANQAEGCIGCLIILGIFVLIASEGFENACVISLVILSAVLMIRYMSQQRARRIEEAHSQALRLSDIDYMDGLDFEEYVSRLLRHMGYSTELTRSSADLGIDIIAKKGGTRYAIQVKRHSNPISRRAVSDAVAGCIFRRMLDTDSGPWWTPSNPWPERPRRV